LVVLAPLAALATSCSSSAPSAPSSTNLFAAQNSAPVIEARAGAAIATRGKPEQIEGLLDALPSSPAGSLVVSGRSVHTSESTTFLRGGRAATFADLVVGQRVRVRGESTGDTLFANVVQIQNAHGEVSDNEEPPLTPPDPLPAFTPEPIVGMANCQVYTCGFEFVPTKNMSVVALGQWDQDGDGLPSASTISLWTASGALLATVSVPSGAGASLNGSYRYVTVPPIALTAGTPYVISSGFAGGQSPVFDPSVGMDPAFAATTGRFMFGAAFPSAAMDMFFGGANFQFVPVTP
jgi:hypothetical protein